MFIARKFNFDFRTIMLLCDYVHEAISLCIRPMIYFCYIVHFSHLFSAERTNGDIYATVSCPFVCLSVVFL